MTLLFTSLSPFSIKVFEEGLGFQVEVLTWNLISKSGLSRVSLKISLIRMRLVKSSTLGKIKRGFALGLGTNFVPNPKYFLTEVGIFIEE